MRIGHFARSIFLGCAAIGAVQLGAACNYKIDIPTEFPSPPPKPVATPLAKLELRRDAELEQEFARIGEAAKGKVGAMALDLQTGAAATLSAEEHFPMQSVYKLPIAMAVMDQVRLEKLDLEEKIGVTKDDMVRAGMRSPLRDENPNGGEFTIRELIRLSMVESDGTASDVQLRVLGGAPEVQSFLSQIGIREMKAADTEKVIGKDWETQYRNYSTPAAAVELLRWLDATNGPEPKGHGSAESNATLSEFQTLVNFMAESKPGAKRLKGELPPGTFVAHKTGTGGTRNNITGATNDIGLIRLTNGKRIAIAVFVSDSPADEKTREAVIARIAKAAWDRWNK